MKTILKIIIAFLLISNTFWISAVYNSELNKNPIFMENVYNFINTQDSTDWVELSYCEEVYLEATRRREYTEYEINFCWDYFTQKNNEEKAYIQYMFNNRELFY